MILSWGRGWRRSAAVLTAAADDELDDDFEDNQCTNQPLLSNLNSLGRQFIAIYRGSSHFLQFQIRLGLQFSSV